MIRPECYDGANDEMKEGLASASRGASPFFFVKPTGRSRRLDQ
jgi:hypothetical protein